MRNDIKAFFSWYSSKLETIFNANFRKRKDYKSPSGILPFVKRTLQGLNMRGWKHPFPLKINIQNCLVLKKILLLTFYICTIISMNIICIILSFSYLKYNYLVQMIKHCSSSLLLFSIRSQSLPPTFLILPFPRIIVIDNNTPNPSFSPTFTYLQ